MGIITMLKNVPKGLVKAYGTIVTKASTNKPQIIFWMGIAFIFTGAGWAIYNATKVPDTIKTSEATVEEKEYILNRAREAANEGEEDKALIVTYEKDLRKAKTDSIVEMAKLMGLPILTLLAGIGFVIWGEKILVVRFGEVSAAFAALQKSFDQYRQWNIREHGEECDRRYRYGIVEEATTTAEITDEKGKTKKVKCKVPVVDENEGSSMYQFCFSEDFSSKCPKDPVTMISFLRAQEKYWNLWMETRHKPVTLYMILNDLGIELDPDDPRNDYVMIAGWRPNGDGDNHIDFGIMRACNKPALDMLENVCFLNFNCDGNLYHSKRYGKDGRMIC